MNKRISKITLGLVSSVMIITSIGLIFMNKDKSNVVDIYGKRDELGEVSVVYQERQGYYKTKEVIVDRDKLEVDEFAKETPSAYSKTNFVKEHRDLLLHTYAWYTKSYEDDESLGYVELVEDYTSLTEENQKIQYVVNINEKNLKNKQIKTCEIPLDFYKRNDDNSEYISVPVKYNGELYIVIGYDCNPDYMKNGKRVEAGYDDSIYETNENTAYGAKESQISVFKLDTKSQSSEHIFTKTIGNDNEVTLKSKNISFAYNDAAYILNYSYKLNKEKKYERQISFLTYNIATQKFENIDLPLSIDEEHYVERYIIENNILTLIAKGEDEYGSTHFYISKINLDTNEIIINSERYDLSIDDNNEYFNMSINDIRIIDNKIYLTVSLYEDTEYTKNINSEDKKYVSVLDENSKEILYVGKLLKETNGYVSPSIVTKEEL